MRARVERLLRRLGAFGVLGIGVLIACAAFTSRRSSRRRRNSPRSARRSSGCARARPTIRSRRTAAPRSCAASTACFPRRGDPPTRSRACIGWPPRRLDLAQGDYRLERRTTGLWAYRVNLPVRGTYAQLREFSSSVLKEMPVASIEALRFERKKAADPQLEAQVRLTVHVRPQAEAP